MFAEQTYRFSTAFSCSFAATGGITPRCALKVTLFLSIEFGNHRIFPTRKSELFEFNDKIVSSILAEILNELRFFTSRPDTTGTNQVELRATVRDTAGNAVKGVTVNFTAVKDLVAAASNGHCGDGCEWPGGGCFISGAVSTAANGVEIRATVAGTAIAGTVPLTVSEQSLFINIAANNTIEKLNHPPTVKPSRCR